MNNANQNYLYFTSPQDYHKEYYKKNRLVMKAKRDELTSSKLTQEVLDWKKTKEKDPYALFPFYDGKISTDNSLNTSSSSSVPSVPNDAIKC